MASLSKDAQGNRTIQFIGKDRRRRSIRLGHCSQRQAEAVKVQVERLVHASLTGHPADPDTSRWLTSIDGQLADRLAAVGLIPAREAATLGAFLDRYQALRTDVKPGTHMNYRQTEANLLQFFSSDRLLSSITPGDADAWRVFLASPKPGGLGLAENTLRRRIGRAKQFFHAAVRQKLIPENPFADQKANVQGNPERFYFLSREDAVRILEACPNAEWRAIFALSRFGGLRCPSEHLELRWADIDWHNGRIHVTSPKTAHHVGGESRMVPLFPELRTVLRDAFELAPDGAEFVITRYRDAKQNLRTTFTKIIRRAGLIPWPKLFQNLRSTRETELAELFPMHVVCAWIGNSQPVASKHYLQVTGEHFTRASCTDSEPVGQAPCSALQNPVQQSHEPAGNPSQPLNRPLPETLKTAGDFGSIRRIAVNKGNPVRTRT